MKVTAILLCYNQEAFIAQNLKSILEQDFQEDWELVISDDASTDNSCQIVQDVLDSTTKSPYLKQIIFHKNKTNQGIAGNLQSAFNYAKGEWIAKFDGDDIAAPERLSSLIQLSREFPDHLMYASEWQEIDEHDNHIQTNTPKLKEPFVYPYKPCIRTIKHIYCPFGSVAMYHRSLFDDFSPLPSGKAIADDTILGFRAYLKKSGFVKSEKKLTYYRQHYNNISNFIEPDPKLQLIKRSHYSCITLGYEIAETCNQYRLGNLTYKETNRLLKLLHAEQQRLLLFPYASFENNLLTKLKWYITILKCRPELWLLSLPRLLPNFLVTRYLSSKEKIKKIISKKTSWTSQV